MPRSDDLARAGDDAAAVALFNQRGEAVRLEDLRGRNVVVYFYPKDDTPGCTIEGKEFRDLHERFAALDCAVVGVSVDSVDSHRAFAEKHALPFVLLSDPRGELARAFGVLRNGLAVRSSFVLDRELRIRHAFHEVAPRGHAQQVLNFVRTMLESHRMLGG